MKHKTLLILIIIAYLIKTIGIKTFAQTPNTDTKKLKAVIVAINMQGHPDFGELYQELGAKLDNGDQITIINNPQTNARSITYEVRDKVIVQKFSLGQNTDSIYTIIDYQRTNYITFLFIIFVIIAVLVGKKHGIYSLLGMGVSFFMIFKFILPQIIKGANPVLITVIASLFIIPITFYLSHGFNKKTHIAIVSTVFTLIITTVLTSVSVAFAKLTGYSSEEAMFLQVADKTINMKGILLAGIIIGFLGVLDDVTVSQSSIVAQLKKSKRNYESAELYRDAMNVGRDHITSMINTLVLVYSGASMPLLLLFVNNPQPFMEVINIEIIADEIIRTLVGSIGLILAVPLSTFIASYLTQE
jgi:uncharacterized membrane protein